MDINCWKNTSHKVPGNAQSTLKFGAVMLLEVLDTWLESKLFQILKTSPYFSILADECQHISSQEELSVVDGYPDEHSLDILHVKDVDVDAISHLLHRGETSQL